MARRTMYLLMVLSMALAACSSGGRQSGLWAFEGGSISEDGSSIVLNAYANPDESCFEFDRVETEVEGDELIVSLYQLGPTEGQFCNLMCPLGTERIAVPLDESVDPSLTIAKNPATGEHCSESLGN